MGALDTGFGCALIATWFASILLGVAFAQAFDYFRMSENDTKLRKGLVVTVMVLCLSALGAEYAVIYLPTVTFWGDVASLSEESYASPVYSSCNATIALIVNTYLISRFYSVSKNIIVTLVLLVMNLFAAIMTCVPPLLGGGPGHPTTVAGLKNLIPIITTWAIANAVTDLLIALSLVWALRRMKTSFKDTDRLLRRVMILSVQNGCTTALASIGAMIGSLVMPFSSISVLFTYMLGPLYLLTLLSNLNLRGSSKSGSRTWTSSRNHTAGSVIINGIRVERSAITTMDPTSESELEMEARKGQGQEDGGRVHQKQQQDLDGASGFRSQIHFDGTV